jgi:hypothetical protein
VLQQWSDCAAVVDRLKYHLRTGAVCHSLSWRLRARERVRVRVRARVRVRVRVRARV